MNSPARRGAASPWHLPGARMSLFASWAVVFALLVQETLSGLGQGYSLWSAPDIAAKLSAIALSGLYVVWQLRVARGVDPRSTRRLVLLLTAGASIVLIDGQWAPLPLALSAIMFVLSPKRAAVSVAALLVFLALDTGLQGRPELAVGIVPGVFAFAAVLYAFVRLAVVIRELQLTREELARTQVDQERLRIQRDLHDVLGRTLVAASLRNQVALRTLDSDRQKTRDHLDQLHAVLADGQARLREVTSGPVIVSLADEIESAGALCRRVGIVLTVDTDGLADDVPEREMGAIVRETVTNMLKHARASQCSLTIHSRPDAVVVTFVNDGCTGLDPGTGVASGTGLSHLRGVAEGLGGTLTAKYADHRQFQVSALLPRQTDAAVHGPGRVWQEQR